MDHRLGRYEFFLWMPSLKAFKVFLIFLFFLHYGGEPVDSHSGLPAKCIDGRSRIESELVLTLRGGGKKSTSRRKTRSIHNWKAKHKRPGENPLQV